MEKKKNGLGAFLGGRSFVSFMTVAVVIASVVFVNIIAYTLTSYFGLYIYSVRDDQITIGDAGDDLFEEAIEDGKSVRVTFCMDKKEVSEHTSGSFVHNTALQFKEKYPDFISLNYVNVYTKLYSDSEDYEDGEEFDASTYKNYKDVGGERIYDENTNILKTSVIFEYIAKDDAGNIVRRDYRVLTDAYTTAGFGDFYTLNSELVMTSYNGEEVFASMVAWVLNEEHPTAYITLGHGEMADLSLASALSCAGYHIGYVDLKRESVPEDAALVVISNPKNDFERSSDPGMVTEISRLETYKARGGNFLVFLDPYGRSLPVLEAFVAEFGMSLTKTENGGRYMVKDSSNAITSDGFTLVADHSSDETAVKMLAKTEEHGGRVILRDVAAISLEGSARPILVSSSSAVCEADGETQNEDGSYAVSAYARVGEGENESVMGFIPSVYLTASDAMITNGYANKNFLFSVFGELYGMGKMPYGCESVTFNNLVLENLTMGSARLYTALFMSIPVILAGIGAVMLIRRKNR